MQKHTVFLHWPYDRPAPDDHEIARAWRMFTDRMETQGWQFDHVIREWQTPGPIISDKGDVVREYNLEVALKRPPRQVTLHDVPDSAVDKLLSTYKGAKVS